MLVQKSKVLKKNGEEEKKNQQQLMKIMQENLMELHTVSPKAGYSQEDVIQLAYIMTGWQQSME